MNIHGIYGPFRKHFRTKRVRNFYETLQIGPATSILDVGGNGFFWRSALAANLPKPREVTIINIYDQDEELPRYVKWVRADARNMPFENNQFDVAFSNSVIEHYITPFVHWLPQKHPASYFAEWNCMGNRYSSDARAGRRNSKRNPLAAPSRISGSVSGCKYCDRTIRRVPKIDDGSPPLKMKKAGLPLTTNRPYYPCALLFFEISFGAICGQSGKILNSRGETL